MKQFIALILLLIPVISLPGCGAQPARTEFSAMDTFMTVTVYGDPSPADEIASLAKTLDHLLSATDESSEIFAANRDGSAPISADTRQVLEQSLPLCAQLNGDLDITVYPLVELWGFPSGNYRVPDADEIESLLPAVDYSAVTVSHDTLTLPQGCRIDPGAVAKGYLADKARALLPDDACAILNLGGTVVPVGTKPDGSMWKIGVADPDDPAAYYGTLSITDKIISTSGGYERYFEQDGKRYIHILDPHTGRPADSGLLSVTAVSDSGVYADALSTALFVKGLSGALSYYQSHRDFDFVILTDDHQVIISEGIADRFALSDGYAYSITVI